jgi:putative iron-regulated protein
MAKYLFKNLLTLLLLCSMSSCDSSSDSDTTGFTWPSNTADAVNQYAVIVDASYGDSHMTAMTLNTKLTELVTSPSEMTLIVAQQAWLDAREPYLQTEVYRFYDGPIDHPEDGPEGLLNAWPLDENYIDYVSDDANAGIINGTEVIDSATLEGLNEQGGEANIATGYHAIEFLLWGQDLNDDGPGQRPYTDYVTDGTATAANQDRRGQYLQVVGEMLVDHLAMVHAEWTATGEYRSSFITDEQVAFGKILTGMIILSGFETGGERLQAALDSGDREDEHSCFSDNTHRDMIQDVQGIMNVWKGSYTRTNGTELNGVGIYDVVKAANSELAGRLDTQITESLRLANALVVPFENEILPGSDGNARVMALVMSLQNQEAILFEVFDLFGLSVELPE